MHMHKARESEKERDKKMRLRKFSLFFINFEIFFVNFDFFNFEKNLLFYCYMDPRPGHVTLDGNDNECAM